jgi:DNA processing protein
MKDNNDILYLIALSKVNNVGAVLAKNLISYCGSAQKVLNAKKSQLLKIPGIGEKTANEIIESNTLHDAETELNYTLKNNINVLSYLNENFPFRLNRYPDAPTVLYYKGNANLNKEKILSIVGTRAITQYGQEIIEKLICDLKHLDILIVSGLAYGVDAAAHKQCVKEEIETVGVLGHGLDIIYPSLHKGIAKSMIERGGLITEYGINTRPDRENFPQRNRIVAGLCDALVVIETKAEGGSMITAQYAFDYNKDVFAFPGRVYDAYSSGANKLIKSNKAQLIENADDLMKCMSWDIDINSKKINKNNVLFVELNESEQEVMNIIKGADAVHIDVLYQKVDKTPGILASILLELEFKGLIHEHPGKRYTIAN